MKVELSYDEICRIECLLKEAETGHTWGYCVNKIEPLIAVFQNVRAKRLEELLSKIQ